MRPVWGVIALSPGRGRYVAARGHAATYPRLTVHIHHRVVAIGRTQNATDGAATADPDQAPPDLATMRSAVRRLLAEDAQLPSLEELETLTLQLRGHIALLIPEVEATAGRLPKDDVPRY